MTAHVASDTGNGTCPCGRRVATYGGRLQHRRGRVGDPNRPKRPRAPKPRRAPKCASCRRVRRLAHFTLVTEIKGFNRLRREAGATALCEPCWRKLTGRPPKP